MLLTDGNKESCMSILFKKHGKKSNFHQVFLHCDMQILVLEADQAMLALTHLELVVYRAENSKFYPGFHCVMVPTIR